METVGLRRLLVYGGSLFMAVTCQWQVLVYGAGLFIGAAGSWKWLVRGGLFMGMLVCGGR